MSKTTSIYPTVDEAATMVPGVLCVTEYTPNRCTLELATSRPRTRLVVEVSRGEWDGSKGKYSLPWRWYKEGYTAGVLADWWTFGTYHYDDEGNCRGIYDPTVRLHPSGGRCVIDFDWMLPATADNLAALIAECLRMEREDIRSKQAR